MTEFLICVVVVSWLLSYKVACGSASLVCQPPFLFATMVATFVGFPILLWIGWSSDRYDEEIEPDEAQTHARIRAQERHSPKKNELENA